jgi:hypothetical protein
MRHLSVIGLAALGITFMAAQPANAAAVFICDLGLPDGICANGVNSVDPNITFSMNDFEEGFQINSVTEQIGLNNPKTFLVNEASPSGPNPVDGAAENDFSAVWNLGAPIKAENETIFFCQSTGSDGPGALCGPDETAVSDVLHFTYSQDANNHGHLDGTVISDVTGSILISDLNAAGIFATGFADEHLGVFDFSNTNITAKFQSDVPEIDAASGGAAIALLLGVLALVGERRRWRTSELAG